MALDVLSPGESSDLELEEASSPCEMFSQSRKLGSKWLCPGLRDVTLELDTARGSVEEREHQSIQAVERLAEHRANRDALDQAVTKAQLARNTAKAALNADEARVLTCEGELRSVGDTLTASQSSCEKLKSQLQALEVAFVHAQVKPSSAQLDVSQIYALREQLAVVCSEIERHKTDQRLAATALQSATHQVESRRQSLKTTIRTLAEAEVARSENSVVELQVRSAEQAVSLAETLLAKAREHLQKLKEEASSPAERPRLCRRATLPETRGAHERFAQLAMRTRMEWCVTSREDPSTNTLSSTPMEVTAFLASAVGRVARQLENNGDRLLQVNSLRYVRIKKEFIEELENPRLRSAPTRLNFFELLRASLGDPQFRDVILVPEPPRFHETALGLDRARDVAPPRSLKPHLRPYQVAGFQWLASLARNGLGAVLADDMGLGKTLQAITLLLHMHEEGLLKDENGKHCPALVVVPPSLVGNWSREFRKWAMSLRVHVYHGQQRRFPRNTVDVILTTYHVIRRDRVEFCDAEFCPFSCMIIDEAQNIKNHGSQLTRAIKEVGNSIGHTRVALSGTPIENKVDELHSLFDFTNYGYLGDRASFSRDFSRPIELKRDSVQRAEALDLLRRLTQPFQLRRLKTDPNILPELPQKIDLQSVVGLSSEQERLYKAVQDEWRSTMEQSRQTTANHTFERRGHIFAMMEKVRRICCHPLCLARERYPRSCVGLVPSRAATGSGKVLRLMEILDEVIPKGEKVTIFVMRKAVLSLLAEFVAERFRPHGVEVLSFSGDLSLKDREVVTARFCNEAQCQVMILTVAAGGVGLNLTSANHVVHFDRCYNPAKEAQATDRCHRIGQRRGVCVHRLITEGTFEERLEQIMQRKTELSMLTVSAAEDWITKYDDEELFELFMLRAEKGNASGSSLPRSQSVVFGSHRGEDSSTGSTPVQPLRPFSGCGDLVADCSPAKRRRLETRGSSSSAAAVARVPACKWPQAALKVESAVFAVVRARGPLAKAQTGEHRSSRATVAPATEASVAGGAACPFPVPSAVVVCSSDSECSSSGARRSRLDSDNSKPTRSSASSATTPSTQLSRRPSVASDQESVKPMPMRQRGRLPGEARRRVLKSEPLEGVARVSEEVEDCAICMETTSVVQLNPCGHRILCAACALKVQSCPVCRVLITERILVPSFAA